MLLTPPLSLPLLRAGFFNLRGDEFAVFFSVTFNQERAANLLQFMQDGFFIDSLTNDVTFHLTTFNPLLEVFGSTRITFEFLDAGEISAKTSIDLTRVSHYAKPADYGRATLEVIFLLMWAVSVQTEIREARDAHRKNLLFQFLTSPASLVDFLNYGAALVKNRPDDATVESSVKRPGRCFPKVYVTLPVILTSFSVFPFGCRFRRAHWR